MTLFTASSSWKLDEHEMFADTARRFYQDELVPNIDRFVEQGMVDRAFWTKAGEAGIMAGTIAGEYGGADGPMSFDAVALYEQTRAGDCGWGLGIQSIVMHYLVAFGSEEQKAKWLPRLISG